MSVISVEHLTFQYLHATEPALRDVSLEIEAGMVTAVLGANGAGKSTLCYALAGYIPHFFRGKMSGRVRVKGIETSRIALGELVTQVGLVLQNPTNQISGAKLTVAEEIAFGLENLGVARAEMQARVSRALEQFGLSGAAEQSPFTLSGGQQQRLALASIMVMEPEVLVLDEPTSQLDPEGTRQVMETITALAEQGRTIILVEHKLEWVAQLAARVIVLEAGRVVADGAPRLILSRAREWGLIETRYARVARTARERGWIHRDTPLPQTLYQAREEFAL